MRNLKKVLSITAAAAEKLVIVTESIHSNTCICICRERGNLQDWCHRTYDRRLCTVW